MGPMRDPTTPACSSFFATYTGRSSRPLSRRTPPRFPSPGDAADVHPPTAPRGRSVVRLHRIRRRLAEVPRPQSRRRLEGDGPSPAMGRRRARRRSGPPKNLGLGFGAPIIAGGKMFGLGTRDGKDGVWALKEIGWERTLVHADRRSQVAEPEQRPKRSPDNPRREGLCVEQYGASSSAWTRAPARRSGRCDFVKDFGGSIQKWGYTESVAD